MPVSFHIVPSEHLVFVAYDGRMGIAETAEALGAYRVHPDFRPSHHHLLDLTRVTDWERDFPSLMAVQAAQVDLPKHEGNPPMLVFCAPTPIGQSAARAVINCWASETHVLPRLAHDEAAALDILGCRARSFDALLGTPPVA